MTSSGRGLQWLISSGLQNRLFNTEDRVEKVEEDQPGGQNYVAWAVESCQDACFRRKF